MSENVTQQQPTQTPEKPKRSPAIFVVLGVLALIVVVIVFFLLKGKGDKGGSPQIKQMEETVMQIQKLESDVQNRQNEIFKLVRDYKNQTGKDLGPLNMLNLTPEQKQLLEAKIKEEQNVSIKSLLEDILNKNKEIGDLKQKITEVEAKLPQSHVVEQGENHYQIAMDFLVNEKGLDKKKAREMVERTAIFEPLVPGFKVWNFYDNGEYGTFVTQGTAPVSPNSVQRKIKKELVDARDTAISERDKLALDVEELEKRRNELISQINLLNEEKQNLMGKIGDLDKQNQDLQKNLSSLFYYLDLKKNLEAKGVLKGGFLRSTKLQSVAPELFTMSIDLRENAKISVSAAELSIGKIRGITIYPTYFKKDLDYSITIEENKQNAVITILDTKKFMSERLVISIE